MDKEWVAFLAALLGALVGSLASIAVAFIQTRAAHRREKARLVLEVAMADHASQIEVAKQLGTRAKLAPLIAFVHHHAGVYDLLEHGDLTPEAMRELDKEQDALMDYVDDRTAQRTGR